MYFSSIIYKLKWKSYNFIFFKFKKLFILDLVLKLIENFLSMYKIKEFKARPAFMLT